MDQKPCKETKDSIFQERIKHLDLHLRALEEHAMKKDYVQKEYRDLMSKVMKK